MLRSPSVDRLGLEQEIMSSHREPKTLLIAVLIIAAALIAAFYPSLGRPCYACQLIDETSVGFHGLNIVGAIYYSALGTSCLKWGLNDWTKVGIFVALGVHVVLVARLLSLSLFCVPCISCAAIIAAVTFLVTEKPVRTCLVSTLVGALIIFSSSVIRTEYHHTQERVQTEHAIDMNALDLSDRSGLPIYVYEDPNCMVCKEFNEMYIPGLTTKYGNQIVIRKLIAPKGMPTPSLLIGGTNPKLLIRAPKWFDLQKSIDERIQNRISEKTGIYPTKK